MTILPEDLNNIDSGFQRIDPNQQGMPPASAEPSVVIRHNIDKVVADVSPALYAAGIRNGMTREDKNTVENWAKLKDTHEKLMKMSQSKAAESFKMLDPAWQGQLQKYFQVDYAHKSGTSANADDPEWRKILGVDNGLSLGDLFKSPFRLLMHAGEMYGKALNTTSNAIQNSVINRESFWTRANFEAAFDGKMLYDEHEASILIEKHGGATSFVAMHLIAGQTPGEIIDAWGPADTEIIKAIDSVYNDSENFQKIITDFKRVQLSPGRDLARWINRQNGLSSTAGGDAFDKTSGVIDAAFQIFSDPLTYLTFGGSAIVRGASKAEKLAEALRTTGEVSQYLKNAKVAEYFNGYATEIGKFTEATASKDLFKASEIKRGIREKYSAYGTDAEIELFSRAGIKDLDTFSEYFVNEGTKHLSKLLRGLTTDMKYARDGAVFSRKSRDLVVGAKSAFNDLFKGKAITFKATDKKGFRTFVQELLDNGQIQNGTKSFEAADKLIIASNQRGLRGLFERQSSRHPGSKTVFVTDDKVADSLNTFRLQSYLAIGDKTKADLLAETFLRSNPEERFALLRGVHEMIYRRSGIHGMKDGEAEIDRLLQSSFGDYNTFGVRESMTAIPHSAAAQDLGVVAHEILGPIQMSQIKDGIAAPNWREIGHIVAKGNMVASDKGLVKSIPQIIGGAFNSKAADSLTSYWAWLTLVPQLGIRTAIDEGFFGLMYLNLGQARDLRNARRARNVLSAYTGDLTAIGPVKSMIHKLTGTGPENLIKGRDKIKAKYVAGLKTGKYDDIWEAERAARNEIFDLAIKSKYGKNLPEEYQAWLREAAMLNPSILKESSAVHVAEASGAAQQALFRADNFILGKDKLNLAIEEAGFSIGKEFRSFDPKRMALSDVHLAMYRQFITRLNGKGFYFGGDKAMNTVDAAQIFIKHRGLETRADWDKAVNEFMLGFGIKKVGGNWEIAANRTGDVKRLIESTRHFNQYQSLSFDADKVYRFANDVFTDIYHAFHGGAGNFNKALVDHFDDAIKKKTSHRAILAETSFDDYSKLVNGNEATERIYSDIDFGGNQSLNLSGIVRKYGMDKSFEWMSRQSDGITRQPLVHMHYFSYRKEYKQFEQKYSDKIYDDLMGGTTLTGSRLEEKSKKMREIADAQASGFYSERAMVDAANNVLKYADNPEIRTVFSYNARTVGRFYRAVEDFYRRLYRLGGESGFGTIARLRLMNQGLSANGNVHTDPNGQQYMVLPMDNIIYSAVDTTLRGLTGNDTHITQPIFSNLTFNLTAGNPSFQTDAGIPYLSGPMGALSVLAAKGLLGKFDPTKNMAEDIDNFALGNLGDNVTFQKAVTPRLINTLWSMLSPDEKSQQEVSALTQAIAYNQANGISFDPTDDKYFVNGVADTGLIAKDKASYLKTLRVSAHNLIVVRGLLGLISPMAVQSKDIKDLPDYLKDTGIVSMQASFYDLLDVVKKKYPDVQDPTELAYAIWSGDNPGKLAYLVSKKSKEIQPILKYSTQMQDWAVKNNKDVSKYGAGALLFAPNIGEFNPGVWNWASAADLVENVDIDQYFEKVYMQQHVNAYYDLGKEEEEALRGVTFDQPQNRRTVVDFYQAKKKDFKNSVPGLEDYLSSGVDNSNAVEFVDNAYAYATTPGADVPKKTITAITEAYQIYQEFVVQADYIDSMQMSNGSDVKRQQRDQSFSKIKDLIAEDDTKVLEQYFNYGLKKLMTARSRDARAGVGRNI